MGFSRGRGRFAMVIGRSGPRVELYFANDADKICFDAMKSHQQHLNSIFGDALKWQRLDNKKASRIKLELEADKLKQYGDWSSGSRNYRIDWYSKQLPIFYEHVFPIWDAVQKELKKAECCKTLQVSKCV